MIKKIICLFVLVAFSMLSFGFQNQTENSVSKTVVPIIMYHSVFPTRNNAYVVSPEKLESDLKYLKDKNYTPIFISELVDFAEGKSMLPEKPIIITFDDGYYNNYTIVAPLMKKYDSKCNVSIVGDFSDRVEKQHQFYSYLTWEQIAELSKTPYFEFHNHSYSLHNVGGRVGVRKYYGESDEEYERLILSDALKLNQKLKFYTGKEPVCYCYPFGICTSESTQILSKGGFKAFLTCEEKVNHIRVGDTLFHLNRFNRPCWVSTYNFFVGIENQT